MIAGIILAAGQSERMGRPKALLRVEDETFVERAIRVLSEGGCREVVTVLDAAQPALSAVEKTNVQTVSLKGPGAEQIDSLRSGLRALSAAVEAAVVLPVDHPKVNASTVVALIQAFRTSGAPIVLPVHGGKRGHPVLFSAAVFDELLGGQLPEGARTVVHAHSSEIEEVAVDDIGVLLNVDTPADYEDHVG